MCSTECCKKETVVELPAKTNPVIVPTKTPEPVTEKLTNKRAFCKQNTEDSLCFDDDDVQTDPDCEYDLDRADSPVMRIECSTERWSDDHEAFFGGQVDADGACELSKIAANVVSPTKKVKFCHFKEALKRKYTPKTIMC